MGLLIKDSFSYSLLPTNIENKYIIFFNNKDIPANNKRSMPIGIKDFIIHLCDKPVKAEETSFMLKDL